MYEFLEKLKKWMLITILGCGGSLALIAFIRGISVPGLRYYPTIYYGESYRYLSYLSTIREILPLILMVFVSIAAILFVLWLLVKRPKPLVSLIHIVIIATIAFLVWDFLIWSMPYVIKEILRLFYWY